MTEHLIVKVRAENSTYLEGSYTIYASSFFFKVLLC